VSGRGAVCDNRGIQRQAILVTEVSTTPQPLRCATHPDVETYLRCGKCDTPICPRCLVQTPVGARCRTCANLRALPQYQVSPDRYARGVGAGVVTAVALGLIWSVLPFAGFFGFLIGIGCGMVVAEVMLRATKGRTSTPLKVIAVGCVALAYSVSIGAHFAPVLTGPGLAGTGVPVGVIVNAILGALFNPFGLLSVAAGGYAAVQRLR